MLRKIAYVAPVAAMAISLTACNGLGGHKGDSGSDNGSGDVALTAAQVMNKAATTTANTDSYKTDMTVNTVTNEAGKPQKFTISGTGQYQLKPSLAFATTFTSMSMGGQDVPGGVEMRLVDKTFYFKLGALQKLTGSGKPWLKINTAELGKKSGVDVNQLLKTAQDQANPVTYTKIFTESKDVKKVGQADVGGVQTTRYTGTVDLDKALAKLDPKQRQQMKSGFNSAFKNLKFDLFVDNQQLPRKIAITGSIANTKLDTTLLYHDFGQPVHIAAPPAGQTEDAAKLKNGPF